MRNYAPDDILEIKELMRKVNVTEMCRRAGVKRRAFYAAIEGESSNTENIQSVVAEAKKEIRWMKKNKGASRRYNRQL